MSFLQPWLLAGLPLVALPIIIHLINQRRYQTVNWAAMMFLLAARRMARGYSRIRQWLILLFRTAAVAGLVLAVSRPLASGWLGLAAGGKADTTIILLDRSASMQQRLAATGQSKLETARIQLAQTLNTIGSNRWVLIDSATGAARELDSPDALLNLPNAGPTSAPADIPRMLETAHEYIRDQRTGRTEIWIASDQRENDWSPESGRWQTLRDAFLELPQSVRFHLLAYEQAPADNVSVRCTEVRRQQTSEGADLLVSFVINRRGGDGKLTLPVQFEIDGSRSVLNVELTGEQTHYKDHRIPVAQGHERGWGKISIPADEQPADDHFYFAFDKAATRRTLIVADDPAVERPLQLAASISPDPATPCTAEIARADSLAAAAWDDVALVLWQAPLPEGELADVITSFVDRGGRVVFLPPSGPTPDKLFGIQWKSWNESDKNIAVENWRGDEDVLARTLSGAALPVGQLIVRRYCGLAGAVTALATLSGGAPLLARVPTARGGVYFWATTPAPRDSSLATSGVVWYAFVQRALAAGAAVLGKARQLDAGNASGEDSGAWARLGGDNDVLSTEYAYHRGAYSAGDRVLAVNRPTAEDDSETVSDERISSLFRGLDFAKVEGAAGGLGSLVQEIWRGFLLVMLVALLLEAVLCLPKFSRDRGPAP
jgi:hypothetical protein